MKFSSGWPINLSGWLLHVACVTIGRVVELLLGWTGGSPLLLRSLCIYTHETALLSTLVREGIFFFFAVNSSLWRDLYLVNRLSMTDCEYSTQTWPLYQPFPPVSAPSIKVLGTALKRKRKQCESLCMEGNTENAVLQSRHGYCFWELMAAVSICTPSRQL